MSRRVRANSFLLEPARFRTDPKVLAMSVTARGAYAMLFMAGWDQAEPGVFPADDRTLAQFAMCYPDEWASVRDQVATAFDTESRPGFWIQRGTTRTAEAQDRYINRKRSAGSRGGNAKRDNRLASSASASASGSSGSTDCSSATTTTLADGVAPARDRFGFGFGSGSGSVHDSENLPPASLPPHRRRPGHKPIDESLVAKLEAEYPRVDVRAVVAKVTEDFAGVKSPRATLKNCVRIADERGFDLKRPKLTFGEEDAVQ